MKTKLSGIFLILILLNSACLFQNTRELQPFEDNGFFGYKDENGTIIIQPEYIIALEFTEGGIAPVADNDGWVYINRKGERIIRPYIVDNGPDYFSEGLARFVEENKFGFFDFKCKVRIKAQFDYASPFSEGFSAVCKGCTQKKDGEYSIHSGGKWGYINKRGKFLTGFEFDTAGPFDKGKATVSRNGKEFLIDYQGNEID